MRSHFRVISLRFVLFGVASWIAFSQRVTGIHKITSRNNHEQETDCNPKIDTVSKEKKSLPINKELAKCLELIRDGGVGKNHGTNITSKSANNAGRSPR
jgi:hypothetical protein